MGEYLNIVFKQEIYKSHCMVMKSAAESDLKGSSSAGNISLNPFG